MNQVLKKSAPLMCGALLASVCVVESAEAVPTTIGYSAWAHSSSGTSQLSLMAGNHIFGTQNQVFSGPGAGNPYNTVVSSGPSNRPNPATPGQNWQYEMNVNWQPFDPGFFGAANFVTVQLTGIKPAGARDLVSSFAVKRADGSLYTTTGLPGGNGSGIINNGTGLLINVNIGELISTTGGFRTIIQWNQTIIPAPGALALLGFAGVVGGSRRRRSMLN